MDSDRELRLEFRRALDAVTPPAPWLGVVVKDELRRRRQPGSVDRLRGKAPRERWAIAAGIVAVLLAVAMAIAFVATQLYAPVPAKKALPETGNAILPIQSAYFLNAQEGAVVTERGLLLTRDGGQHWQFVLKLDWKSLNDFWFVDANHIVVVSTSSGGAELQATADGGAHWQSNPIAQFPSGGFFINALEGWQLTNPGDTANVAALYHTTDAGAHWTELWRKGSTQPNPDGIFFTDSMHGYMGLISNDGVGRLYVTHDGGRTWQIAVLPPPPGGWGPGQVAVFPDVTMFGNLGVLVQGAGTGIAVYTTADGGQSWGNPRLLPVDANTTYFVDPSDGWAVGDQTLYRSVDGGATWQQVPIHLPAGQGNVTMRFGFPPHEGSGPTTDRQVQWLSGVDYACTQRAQGPGAVGDCFFLLHSTDGGSHWTIVKLPSS